VFSSIPKLLHGMGLRLTVKPEMQAHAATQTKPVSMDVNHR